MRPLEVVMLCSGWFVSGVLGVFIGNSNDDRKNIGNTPESVWFVLLGPTALIMALSSLFDDWPPL